MAYTIPRRFQEIAAPIDEIIRSYGFGKRGIPKAWADSLEREYRKEGTLGYYLAIKADERRVTFLRSELELRVSLQRKCGKKKKEPFSASKCSHQGRLWSLQE